MRELLGSVEVLEATLAEIADRDARGQLVLDELSRGPREQHLPSVAGGRNTSGLVNAEPDVAILADARLARVQPHPHLDLDPVGPGVRGEITLSIDCRCDSVLASLEGDEERVALGVDLPAVVCRERGSQDALMLGEHVAVDAAQLLQQLGRAFDVGEEKRDGSAGQLAHVADSLPHPRVTARAL